MYKGNKYNLSFKKEDYANAIFNNDTLYICYQFNSDFFTAPNNLIAYTPTAKIKKIISPPVLPNGKQAIGFFQVWKIENKNFFIPNKFRLGIGVTVAEHERSEWLYQYFFNPDTDEFLFFNRFRY